LSEFAAAYGLEMPAGAAAAAPPPEEAPQETAPATKDMGPKVTEG